MLMFRTNNYYLTFSLIWNETHRKKILIKSIFVQKNQLDRLIQTIGMFNLAKPNLGLPKPSWVCLFLTEHTKTEFAKPFFLFNIHLIVNWSMFSLVIFIYSINSSVILIKPEVKPEKTQWKDVKFYSRTLRLLPSKCKREINLQIDWQIHVLYPITYVVL
jgi:hypothetical protein